MALLVAISVSGLTQNSAARVIPNAYIVQVGDTVDVHQVAGAAAKFTGGNVGHVYTRAVRGFAIHVPAGVKRADILLQRGILKVELDLEITLCSQTLPTGIDRIDIELNGTAKIDGIDERLDVDIAVIDTGIDPTHPDLNVYAAGSRNFTPGRPSQWQDGDGHGTHVAGIIGALDNNFGVVGIAPGARLWAIKVIKENGPSWLSNVLAGVDWVTANADKIEVVNMSLSAGGRSDIFRQAVQNSIASGIVYVVAAGNAQPGYDPIDVYGPDGIFNTSDDVIPAAYPEVAAISAMADSDGRPGGKGSSTSYGPDDSFASFSNFSRSVVAGNPVSSPGAAIDLLMPGVDIHSTFKDGLYAIGSGTSMASPHGAGLAALYIAEHGRATNANGVYAIRQALINSAVAQADSRGLAVQNDPDDNKENIGYYVPGDFNDNGLVDFEDLAMLAGRWLQDAPSIDIAPLGGDNIINFLDFARLVENWMP